MKLYPKDTPKRFEFPAVLQRLEHYAASDKAKEIVRELLPVSEFELIDRWLNQTGEAKSIVENGIFFPDYHFPNIKRELAKLLIQNAILEGQEAIKIKKVTEIATTVIHFLAEKRVEYPALREITEGLFTSKELIQAIDAVLEPNGFVRTKASRELGQARKYLDEARLKANKTFEASLRKYKKLGWLREYEESFYHDRRVLAVLSEHKRQIDGTLHGSSESGSTTFIEPAQMVQLNNDVAEARQREYKEEMRILKELTNEIREYRDIVISFERALGFLDFTFAKARLAIELDASKPIISREKNIWLRDAYHPILLLQNKKEKKTTVPLSLNLDHRKRILIISGPNAGGKSISLKTLGLLQVMFQSGMLVPANEESRMGIFKQMFIDIGDDQSIAYELSTYSSRLLKMKHFLSFAHKQTLFFIDEFGTGSDPELGGAIAEVILEELGDTKAFGVITTHYANIKVMAERHEAMTNACMLFDEETLQPKYELYTGHAGSSYTFEVARKIGLKEDLVERAKDKLDDRKVKYDKLLVTLQTKKNQLNKETSILQQEKSRIRKEIDENKRATDDYKQKSEDLNFQENKRLIEKGKKYEALLEGWKVKKNRSDLIKRMTLSAEKEAARQRKAQQSEKANEKKHKAQRAKTEKRQRNRILEELKKNPLKVGDSVSIKGTNQIGVIEELKKTKATVVFGMVKTIVPLEKLQVNH